MKKNIKYSILVWVAFVMLVFASCNTAEQDVSPIIDPSGYPVATFTSDLAGNTVKEGDVITYTITLNKMLDRSVTFTLVQTDGTADDHDIIIPASVVISPYTLSASFTIEITEDMELEEVETLSFELGAFGLADKYLLNPSTVNPKVDLSIQSNLTVSVGWDAAADDWDVYGVDQAGNDDWTGYAGATSHNPEVFMFGFDIPDDTYYIEIDAWDVASLTDNFVVKIGHPDGTMQEINFVYDDAKSATYPVGWYYQIVKVVKSGTTYTCTLSPEFQ